MCFLLTFSVLAIPAFFFLRMFLACVKLQKKCAGIVWHSALTLQGILNDT